MYCLQLCLPVGFPLLLSSKNPWVDWRAAVNFSSFSTNVHSCGTRASSSLLWQLGSGKAHESKVWAEGQTSVQQQGDMGDCAINFCNVPFLVDLHRANLDLTSSFVHRIATIPPKLMIYGTSDYTSHPCVVTLPPWVGTCFYQFSVTCLELLFKWRVALYHRRGGPDPASK